MSHPDAAVAERIALSAVVPCYNESECLSESYKRLSAACENAVGQDFEIIFVNDGSTDETWTLILEMIANHNQVVGVNLSRNHGHQLALSAGLSMCRGERVLVLDADLQDSPELLGEMLRLMDEGADVVYGQRLSRRGETWFKKATAAAFYRVFSRLTDVDLPANTGDFRLMSRRVVDALLSMPEHHRFLRGMVAWLGFRQVALHYHRDPRFAGTTKYPFRKMVRFSVDALASFSIRPLRVSVIFAVIFALGGTAVLTYALSSWFVGKTVPGWTSVMVVVLALGSVQLFVIGVFGEYLGRLYIESKGRPLFIIDQVVRAPGAVRSASSPGQETTTANAPAQSPSSLYHE